MQPTAQNLIAWMSQREPDDWHRVAINWNWDGGYDVLHWIIAQPRCDLRTAQVLFALSSPDYFLAFTDRLETGINIENFDFTLNLVTRAHAGQFLAARFTDEFAAEYPRFLAAYLQAEAQHRANGLPWELPGGFAKLAQGSERITSAGFTEGYPPVFSWELPQ